MASGIAGLITLSTAVLAVGYKYVNSVSSAPAEFRSLICETASFSALISQLISHSVSGRSPQQIDSHGPKQQDFIQDCEQTLRKIQSLIRDCELLNRPRRTNAVNLLLWPVKQKEIVKHREHLARLCADLHTAISIESASNIRNLEHEQRCGNEIVRELAHNAHEIQEQKMLDWLSTLDPAPKHTATTLLAQPGTGEWFLKEQIVLDWLDHGAMLWFHGSGGTGKTVLM